MLKKITGIFLVLVMLAEMITLAQAAENTGFIESPAAFEVISSDELALNIRLPSGSLGGEVYLDGGRVHTFGAAASERTEQCRLDISASPAGRHILGVKIKSAAGWQREEIPVTFADGDMPQIKSLSYTVDGKQIPDTDWQNGISPLLTKDGYSVTFAAAYEGISAENVKFCFISAGKKVYADADINADGAAVKVKPKRVPPADTVCIIEFKNLSYNGESISKPICAAFIPKQSDAVVFGAFFFEEEGELKTKIQDAAAKPVTNGMYIERQTDDTGAGTMRFYKPAGLTSGSFADAYAENAATAEKYVIDFRIKVNSLNSSQTIRLFDGKDADGKWSEGIEITRSGTRCSLKQKNKALPIASFTTGLWVRYALAVDTVAGKYDLYKGERYDKPVKSGITRAGAQHQTFFRIDMEDKAGGGLMDFQIDDLKIYEGSVPRGDVAPDFMCEDSVIDRPSAAKQYIGNAAVYSAIGDNYYADGRKEKYPEGAAPVIIDGEPYVNGKFTSEVLGAAESADGDIYVGNTRFSENAAGTVEHGGRLYVRAQLAAKALGKSYLWDERGYFVLSDGEFAYKNSAAVDEGFEPADLIYRYACYDAPRGEEILQDIENGGLYGVHPRILYTDEDLRYIRERAKTDPELNSAIINAVQKAQDHIGWEIITGSEQASEKQNSANRAQNHIAYFAAAYLLSGNEDFAEFGVKLMDNAIKWTSLAWKNSNLTIGHWAMMMAIGYDSFYNYLTKTEGGRAKLAAYREAIARLAFADGVSSYGGSGGPHWAKLTDNFTGVVGGGLGALALCVADEEDLRDDAIYILENVLKTNALSAGLYSGDGGYFEGVGYSEFMLENLMCELGALTRMCGGDYGISDTPGFSRAGDFIAYMQTPAGSIAFSDDTGEVTKRSVPSLFAYLYGRKTPAAAWLKMSAESGYTPVFDSVYYLKRAADSADEPPLDNYYGSVKSGSFRDSFDTATPVFAGFHAMENGTAHDHLDAGQFVFEADGVRWAYDLGRDNYGLSGYFRENGYRLYRKNAEGHNVLLINPVSYTTGYYGQNTTGKTTLERYETEKNGAFAVFDLGDVYSRDVSEYRRGFYFGDARSTLTVQDELMLKSASDIEWNMHTVSDDVSVIDKNTVLLKSGRSSLTASIYCNVPFEIEVRDPQPVWASAESGQGANSGKKLVLKLQGVSGRVNIAVKLIPGSAEADALTFVPMAQWSAPAGAFRDETALSDAKYSMTGEITARAAFADGIKAPARVLLDGEEIGRISPAGSAPYYFGAIPAITSGGRHTLAIADEDGTAQETELFKPHFVKNTIIESPACAFARTTWLSATAQQKYSTVGGFKAFVSGENYSKNADSVSFATTGKGEKKLGFFSTSGTSGYKKGIIVMSADFNVDDANQDIMLEFMHEKSSYRQGYLPTARIAAAGSFANGEAVETGRWYNVRMIFDIDAGTLGILLDGKILAPCSYDARISEFLGAQFMLRTNTAGAGVSFKNYSVELWSALPENIDAEISLSDGSLDGVITIPAAETAKGAQLRSVLAQYDADSRLVSAGIEEHTLTGAGDTLTNSCAVGENTKSAKLMLLDGGTPVIPAAIWAAR